MPFERWGSLSVDDHVDTQALVANVLLAQAYLLARRLAIPCLLDPRTRPCVFPR